MLYCICQTELCINNNYSKTNHFQQCTMINTFWLCGKTTDEEELILMLLSGDNNTESQQDPGQGKASMEKPTAVGGTVSKGFDEYGEEEDVDDHADGGRNIEGANGGICPYVPLVLNDVSDYLLWHRSSRSVNDMPVVSQEHLVITMAEQRNLAGIRPRSAIQLANNVTSAVCIIL